MSFKTLNLIQPILSAIEEAGYETPTPIQAGVIPHVLQEKDIIGCAQTGTGKTAAFAIPILQLLESRPAGKKRKIRALVLAPTRELAIQIEENFKTYSKQLPLKTIAIFGGVSQTSQVNALRSGVDILVATPGRLLDLIQQGFIRLGELEILVLDEADRMLDMGFVDDVKRIIRMIPEERQTLFFSATMPKSIRKFAQTILTNPTEISVAPVSSTAETVQQQVYFVEKSEKSVLLRQLFNNPETPRSLVFTRTKHTADKLVKLLDKINVAAAAIHGNKSQNARQRALDGFKSNKLRVLVATDIAARGIDIDELSNVINFDIPEVPETYVHRIGRTGRAQRSGTAVSFCSKEERADLKNIQTLIGKQIPSIKYDPNKK